MTGVASTAAPVAQLGPKEGVSMAGKGKAAVDDVDTEQHPALEGDDGLEVAARSQDVHEDSTGEHLKVFVVLKRQIDPWGDADLETFHENNIRATRQYAMAQGLRPTSDGRFVGREDNVDGLSYDFTYGVDVTPAVVADKPEVAHAPAEAGDDPVQPGEDTAGNPR